MRSMFKGNQVLVAVAAVAVVNALGYGIIIPILYSYVQTFGLSDFASGMMFAVFSLCSFLSAPVIGVLSDRYGRKPLLLISLTGTLVSFVLMAMAKSPVVLFLARALDGLTAGNIPVVQAVISDSLPPAERAKGFGIIGAAFGFGFVFGPAISAATVGFGVAVPFVVAAVITMVAILLTMFLLGESNRHRGEVAHRKLFDFKKLAKAVLDEKVGKTLLITLVFSFAFGLFIFAYQPVSVKQLHLSPTLISINFTIFGLVGLVSQMLIIPRFVKKFGDKQGLVIALSTSALAFVGMYILGHSALAFMLISILLGLGNSLVQPVINSLLSREVDPQSQGEIMGINASYMSLGNIFGPVAGGIISTMALGMPFLVGGLVAGVCVWIASTIKLSPKPEHLH